jgi:hypothetical protein
MHCFKQWLGGRAFALALPALALSGAVCAQDIKLPGTSRLTAYDTGSSGFNMAIAVGKMFKDKHGTDMRVLPAGNDVARLAPLRANRAQASAMGIGSFFAQEGVFEFASKEWGPQPLRLMLSSTDCNAVSLAVTKDVGVKGGQGPQGQARRRGRRLARAEPECLRRPGIRGLEHGRCQAGRVLQLRRDVEGHRQQRSRCRHRVDHLRARPRRPKRRRAASSIRRRHRPTRPAGRASTSSPRTTCRTRPPAGRDSVRRRRLRSLPIRIRSSWPTRSQPADLVYSMTKSMIVNYASYKDGAPGATGLELSRQNLTWVLPYHEGAVKAFREAGVWKPEHEAHNQKLVKRQDTLAAAWAGFNKANPPEDKDAFRKAWSRRPFRCTEESRL